VNDQGQIVGHYRKIHLFDVNIPGVFTAYESNYVNAGEKLVVVSSPFGNLGLSVCYDVRFPEFYASLTRLGSQITLIPAAFTLRTGLAHWTTLLRARAIETQTYVLAAAQVGKHNTKTEYAKLQTIERESYGHSCIIDPWGTVLAEAPEGVGVAYAEIDLDRIHSVRRNLPCLQHQKPQIYRMSKL